MNFRIIDGPQGQQGSPEWLAFREDKIGSSDAANIMGMGFCSPLQLWEEKIFKKKKNVTKAMKRGTDLEAKAREWVNSKLKVNFQPAVIQSVEHPELIASLDGFEMKGSIPFLLEIKCPGPQDHEIAIGGIVPPHYFPQIQHQMMIADVEEMLYCSFDGEEGVIILCYRDDVFCTKLRPMELAFIQRLADFRPPEAIDSDWVEIFDQEKIVKVERLRELELLIDEIETERQDIREELKKDIPHARCKIGNLKIQRILRKGAVDFGSIEELKMVDLENYRKPPIELWRFNF